MDWAQLLSHGVLNIAHAMCITYMQSVNSLKSSVGIKFCVMIIPPKLNVWKLVCMGLESVPAVK